MTKFEWFKDEWTRCKNILKSENVLYKSGKYSHQCAEDALYELNLIYPEFGLFDGQTGKLVGMREFDLQAWRIENADLIN